MDKTWKAAERRIAKILGGRRYPANTGGPEDIEHEELSVQVKHRKNLPIWIKSAILDAEATAGARLPIAVLHERYSPYEDSLVIMRLSEFVEWWGGSESIKGGEN